MIGRLEFRCFPIGGIGTSTKFEDVCLLKSPPCLFSLTLCVFGVLGEFVRWSYCWGLVGYVVFAEGGIVVLEMEEMFLRRLVIVLWGEILFFVLKSVWQWFGCVCLLCWGFVSRGLLCCLDW